MHLKRLTLQNFRSYSFTAFSPSDGPIVLIGPNGAGKTNVLEALSLFAPGRGLRRAQLKEMAKKDGGGGFAIAAKFIDETGLETDLATGLESEMAERQVLLSGARLKGAELESLLQVIWLTPQQDGLFLGSGGDRRRFFDRLALTFDPRHNTHVNAFEKAMRGRNRLLEEGASPAYFRALEEEMAHLATIVAAGRLTLLKALRSELADLASDDFPIAEIAIEGALEEALLSKSAVEVEEDYQKNLNDTRARDMAAGRTLSGPHRSDFLVRHRDKDMAADQCSTGEQKALLLNLVLAHTALLGKARRDTPTLLLLDEVAAHFDENRRETLFKRLESLKAQPWLTGTDAHLFASLRAQKFSVSSGAITAL